jgi:hypothetical protein
LSGTDKWLKKPCLRDEPGGVFLYFADIFFDLPAFFDAS